MYNFYYLQSDKEGAWVEKKGWFESQLMLRRFILHECTEDTKFALGEKQLIANRKADSCAFVRRASTGPCVKACMKGMGKGKESYKMVPIEVQMHLPYEEGAELFYYHTLEGETLHQRGIEKNSYKGFQDILRNIRESGAFAYETAEDEKINVEIEIFKKKSESRESAFFNDKYYKRE